MYGIYCTEVRGHEFYNYPVGTSTMVTLKKKRQAYLARYSPTKPFLVSGANGEI